VFGATTKRFPATPKPKPGPSSARWISPSPAILNPVWHLYHGRQHPTCCGRLRREPSPLSMLSIRIRSHTYRISNETLDRVFGENWRQSSRGLLQKRIQDHHDAGRLVIRGQRLQIATPVDEAEQRLRSAESQPEILRWGLLYVGSQLGESVNELRALREGLTFDESASTAKLFRDPSPEREQERA
jgi:hypothetical protein